MRKEYEFKDAKRGEVIATPPRKTRVTIRLDNTVLDWFEEQVGRRRRRELPDAD
jgi:uncharacterized protein (DUF4415 family)